MKKKAKHIVKAADGAEAVADAASTTDVAAAAATAPGRGGKQAYVVNKYWLSLINPRDVVDLVVM